MTCYINNGKPLAGLSRRDLESLPPFLALKKAGRLAEVEALLHPPASPEAKEPVS